MIYTFTYKIEAEQTVSVSAESISEAKRKLDKIPNFEILESVPESKIKIKRELKNGQRRNVENGSKRLEFV